MSDPVTDCIITDEKQKGKQKWADQYVKFPQNGLALISGVVRSNSMDGTKVNVTVVFIVDVGLLVLTVSSSSPDGVIRYLYRDLQSLFENVCLQQTRMNHQISCVPNLVSHVFDRFRMEGNCLSHLLVALLAVGLPRQSYHPQ